MIKNKIKNKRRKKRKIRKTDVFIFSWYILFIYFYHTIFLINIKKYSKILINNKSLALLNINSTKPNKSMQNN